MHDVFVDFGLFGGEVLIFQLCRRDCFKVYIIGVDCCEIKYPAIVHSAQNCVPKTNNMLFDVGVNYLGFLLHYNVQNYCYFVVSVRPEGWRFVKHLNIAHGFGDAVVSLC